MQNVHSNRFPRTLLALLFLALAVPAFAQVDVRGQFFLPDGSLPKNNMRFYLTSDDGRINEYRFTDSNGRFILERLSNRISYTITVDSDGASYGPSTYHFMPAYEQVVRFTLNPLPRKRSVPASTLSASSAYKPAAKAVALHDRAMKEIRKKHNEAGERLLQEAIAADPAYAAPLNDLGVLLMGRKDYASAEKVLRQALADDPKAVNALLNLGITLNHLGKYSDAIVPLRETTRLQPGLALAHQHLGIALVEADQFAEAEKQLDLAAKSRHADQPIVQLYRGKLYATTGDFDKSIDAFNAYLRLAPQATNGAEVRSLIVRMQELKKKAH